MKYILIIIILVIGLTIVGTYLTLHQIGLFFVSTPEDTMPPPPPLSQEDIRVLENYLGIAVPDGIRKMYAYYDSHDRYHLYVRIDFDPNTSSAFLSERKWDVWNSLESWEKEKWTRPILRRYVNMIAHDGGEILKWWNPNPDKVLNVFNESYEGGNETVSMLYEEDADVSKAYIVKSRWSSRPSSIDPVLTKEVNWYLRESELYPMKSKLPTPVKGNNKENISDG